MRLFRWIRAKMLGVPFREEEWYNYSAMKTRKDRAERSFNHIIIFGEDGNYINCPDIGGMVTYCYNKKLYKYKVVGFKNESRYRDWLYDGDWINPIIEFVAPIKE